MNQPADLAAECTVLTLRVTCAACQSSAVIDSESLGLWTDAHYLPAASDALIRLPDGQEQWVPVLS
jgi:hypothetical protein